MQFYLDGITPLFWNEVASQPSGLYNKELNQSSSAAIKQLFVAFVDVAVGTQVRIMMNDAEVATAFVMDDTGLVYARFPIPYSSNNDTINVRIYDYTTNALYQSEYFSTSHIAFTFEAQADAMRKTWDDAEQLTQDNNVLSSEDLIMGGKFGTLTGLQRRREQTMDAYREQTACLLTASPYSGTTKGLLDAIHCLVGSGVFVGIITTKANQGNRIYTNPRFKAQNNIFAEDPPHPMMNDDTDDPHYYMADIPAKFRLAYDDPPGGTDPSPYYQIFVQGTPSPVDPGWNETVAQIFRFRTLRAIGNEVIVTIGSTLYDATVEVATEVVYRQTWPVAIDQMSNKFVASPVIIAGYTEGAGNDFIIDRLNGAIEWLSGGTRPADGANYVISYRYRLDEALQIVIGRFKPAFRSVVAVFIPETTGLPLVVRA